MPWRTILFIALFGIAGTASARASIQRQSDACYWVTGRLFYSNGTPAVRIWPRGTKRILGVLNRQSDAEADDVLPDTIEKMNPSFERSVWGRFHVCPLTPDHAGRMRMVYLNGSSNLVIFPYRG